MPRMTLLISARDGTTQPLDLSLSALRFQAAQLRGPRWSGFMARLRPFRCSADQVPQPPERFLAVPILGWELPRVDDQHALVSHLLPGDADQALAHVIRQRWRVPRVESKLDRRRHLVHVLAARPRRAHKILLNFAIRDRNAPVNHEQFGVFPNTLSMNIRQILQLCTRKL
jgi:hypothetical protein